MSLKVWLPLNGNLDNKGCGVVKSISGTPLYKDGKTGAQALDLSSRVTFTFPCLANLSTFSVCFWAIVEPSDSITGNWQDVIGFTDVSIEGKNGSFRWESGYTSASGIHWHDNATNALVNGSIYHTRNYNEWCHCCVAFDNKHGKVYSYTNGVLAGTHTHAGGHFNSVGSFYLGETDKIEGRIGDVRFYDHALSATEVHEIAQGLVLHYKLDGPMGGSNENLLPCGGTYVKNNPWTTSLNRTDGFAWVTNSAFEATPSTTYTISVKCDGTLSSFHGNNGMTLEEKPWTFWLYISNVDTTKNWRGGSYDTPINLTNSNHNYRKIGNTHVWTYTLSSTQKYISLRTNSYSNGTDNLTINWWNMKIEKGNKFTSWVPPINNLGINATMVTDSSGYGHNGTINGTLTTSSDAAKYSSCVYMPKTTTITHSRPIYGGIDQEWTCCMWVKLDTVNQSNVQMNNFNLGNRIVHTANGNALLYLNEGVNDYYNYGNLTVSAGIWTHIAFVFKNSNATKLIYINGVNHTNTNGPNKTSTPNGIPDIITVGTNLAGYISDYRIYATAISDQDILNLYNVGTKITNSNGIHSYFFKESGSRELLSGVLWTDGFTLRNTNTPSVNVTDGEYVLIGTKSIGTPFIPIDPVGHEYYYDIEVSTDADNSFWIGFERYDADKTPRTNQATVYLSSLNGVKMERDHQRYRGTVNLSTDGVNPCAFIALRVLNDWYNPNGYKAIIHRISLREVSEPQTQSINKNGIFETDELIEGSKAAFFKDGLVEAEQFVEM